MEQPNKIEPEYPIIPERWLANYLPMWLGQVISVLGSALVQFALVWYLTEKTGSATVLAMAMLVALIPEVFLGPFSGAIVDRLNRKSIMIVSDLLVALATLVLVLLFAFNQIQIWHIYVILFIRAFVGTFQYPAMSASVSLMVPRQQLTRLGGINQAARGAIQIAAPPLGALLLKSLPMQGILAIDLVTAALAILLLIAFVKVPQPKNNREHEPISPRLVLQDVAEGIKYTYAWKGMFFLMLGATFINMLATPAFTLLPLYVTKHFMKGATELAWLESAMGIGVIIGGLLLGVWGGFKRKVLTTLIGILGLGFGILTMGLVSKEMYVIAIGLMGFSGISSALANGPIGAIFQTKIPPEMQGRVLSVLNSLATAATPLGLIFAGPLADRVGLQPFYIMAGLMCVGIAMYGFIEKRVFYLEDQQAGGEVIEKPRESTIELMR